jgi:hypothetical protein
MLEELHRSLVLLGGIPGSKGPEVLSPARASILLA